MSAAAARRRKQLAARQKAGEDAVMTKMNKLLAEADDEPTAYEALQLAQSQVRKQVHAGKFKEGAELAYSSALALLQKKRISVASQLLQLLVQVLRETHTVPSDGWLDKMEELQAAHQAAMQSVGEGAEKSRLLRLQREFLRRAVVWSSELGTVRFGHQRLQELLADQCWIVPEDGGKTSDINDGSDGEDRATIMAEAVQHMALAEKPLKILEWLKTLPKPTKAQTTMGHGCAAADRDTLLTRALLLFCAVENLRDANTLLSKYIAEVEERDMKSLSASYMKKDDGKAPAHVIFGGMLLKICEKDARTGPLFSWLMRSFKKELDLMPKQQTVHSYVTRIGKVYFNIQPPPSMLSMMENMMGMMGGGGAGGINPAMMQAALSQMG